MSKTLKVPIFRRCDWLKLKASSMDDIPGTYDDYICKLNKRLAAYKRSDEVVREIEIDYEDMLAFLNLMGFSNIADNRARYIELITNSKLESRD